LACRESRVHSSQGEGLAIRWCDVAGPPGVGKSTLCDPLWGPREIPLLDLPPPPEWHDFCNEITRLLGVIESHPTFTAAVRMNRRSIRKMAVVQRATAVDLNGKDEPYVQTGFVQRGLGFGWRLADMGKPVEELWHFFRLMPVSVGVAFLSANADAIKERNKAREDVPATAHENRSHMVDLMQPAIDFAKEVLTDRGVPWIEIVTQGSIERARNQLVAFAARPAIDGPSLRPRRKIQPVSPPVWF
jgi:hypothetical protein